MTPLEEDLKWLRDLADRIERVSRERITGDLDIVDADKVRELANSFEYERLVEENYPNNLTPGVKARMRELESALGIETLVFEKGARRGRD